MPALSPLRTALGVATMVGFAVFFPLIALSAAVVFAVFATAPLATAVVDDRVRPALRKPAAGRAVLITGCDTGFGAHLAERLDAEGATVFAGCLTEAAVKRLRSSGSPRMRPLLLDVTKQSSVDAAAELVREAVGALDAVVNNAGIVQGHYVEMTTLEQYRACMEVNYFGLVAVTKAVAPLLRLAEGGGRVVNVTSVAGRFSGVASSAYSASKHAAEAFTDSLRQELPGGTRVSLIEPGFTRTPMTEAMDTFAEKAFAAAPEHVREAYGGSSFVPGRKARSADVKSKMPGPEAVIDAMCDALFSRVPKHRYLVGMDSQLLYPWFWRLPSFIVDAVMRAVESK